MLVAKSFSIFSSDFLIIVVSIFIFIFTSISFAPAICFSGEPSPEKMDWVLWQKISSRIHEKASENQEEKFIVTIIFKNKVEPKNLDKLHAAGITVQIYHGNKVQAEIITSQLKKLSTWDDISYIRVPHKAVTNSIICGAVEHSGASVLHNIGLTGRGVKIGIIDGGFFGYQNLLGFELPMNVITKNFRYDICGFSGCKEQRHGTAVAEIIHDMAPEAQLYLVACSNRIEFIESLNWLASQHVDIVSGSLSFTLCGPGDGTSPCSMAAAQLRDIGILPVFANGNSGKAHWAGLNNDADYDGFIDIGLGLSALSSQAISSGPVQVMVNWDDWGNDPSNPHPTQDIDLMVLTEDPVTHELIPYFSKNPQTGLSGQTPTEEVTFYAEAYQTFSIWLNNYNVNRTFQVHVYVDPETEIKPYSVPISVLQPADSPKVLSVGACWHSGRIKDYSSRGPTWDGRFKPDITGFTDLRTAAYPFYPFFTGTSAATPTVAGAAALVKQAHPDWGPDQIQSALEILAEDIGPPGQDIASGAGLLRVDRISETLISPNYQTGFWWNPLRDGTGISLERQGFSDFGAMYTYLDENHNSVPAWLTMAGSAHSSLIGPLKLLAWQGWPLELQPGVYSIIEYLGELSVLFFGDRSGILQIKYPPLNTIIAKWPLEKFRFANGTLTDPRTGWWWDPTKAGNGIFFEFQGTKLFAAWYHYRGDGSARWWSFSGDFPNGINQQTMFITEWYGGPCYVCEQKFPTAHVIGTVRLSFNDNNSATLNWQTGESSGTYNLQKFVF